MNFILLNQDTDKLLLKIDLIEAAIQHKDKDNTWINACVITEGESDQNYYVNETPEQIARLLAGLMCSSTIQTP